MWSCACMHDHVHYICLSVCLSVCKLMNQLAGQGGSVRHMDRVSKTKPGIYCTVDGQWSTTGLQTTTTTVHTLLLLFSLHTLAIDHSSTSSLRPAAENYYIQKKKQMSHYEAQTGTKMSFLAKKKRKEFLESLLVTQYTLWRSVPGCLV